MAILKARALSGSKSLVSRITSLLVLGLIPLTGFPLPFISFGSTSLVFLLAGVGIVFNISRYCREK